MVKIITDSSTLFREDEAKKLQVYVTYLMVTLENKTYKELKEIDQKTFLEKVSAGAVPMTSQPSIGEKIELYDSFDDEMIDFTMADGLSGTYTSACSAKNASINSEKIHVVNTRTLCGPHRYIVEKGAQMALQGKSVEAILEATKESMEDSLSFLIPNDFSFLKRGGRLTPLAATIGGLLKIVPIMTLTEDCKKLEKYATQRTYKSALEKIKERFVEQGVDENYILYVTHADYEKRAEETKAYFKQQFPHTEVIVMDLSPAFIAQGGPKCIAIQSIRK